MTGTVNYLGLPLKNPVIVAAGPWARNGAAIQRAIDAGAAAVVTETITLESSGELCPRIYEKEGSLLNTTLYSPIAFEQWEEELSRLEKKGSFVICNIRGSTPSETAYIASRMERWGADALELSPFTPMAAKLETVDSSPEAIYTMLKTVVDAVQIPVSVRLSYNLSNQKEYVKAIERAGVRGISTVETLKALWGVDIEKKRSLTPTFGGYSGMQLFPVTLASVATLSQLTNCPIAAMGGVRTAENVLESIMLGAAAAQFGSAVMMCGYEVISTVIEELQNWMKDHGYADYGEIRGAALTSLRAFEDLSFRKKVAVAVGTSDAEAAGRCRVACLKEAITVAEDGSAAVDEKRCDGCGLCTSLAPHLFEMKNK